MASAIAVVLAQAERVGEDAKLVDRLRRLGIEKLDHADPPLAIGCRERVDRARELLRRRPVAPAARVLLGAEQAALAQGGELCLRAAGLHAQLRRDARGIPGARLVPMQQQESLELRD